MMNLKVMARNMLIRYRIKDLHGLPLLYHDSGESLYNEITHRNLHYVPMQTVLSHITKLSKRFDFVDADTYFDAELTSKKPLACVTFDDGYLQSWETIIPVLERLKIPTTFYVNSSLVNGEIFWRDNVRKLISDNLVEDFIKTYDLPDTFSEENFYRVSKNGKSGISGKKIKQNLEKYFKIRNISREKNVFCSLENLKQIENYDYIKLGNHSSNHLVMSSLDYNEQEKEIVDCQSFLYANFDAQAISNIFSMPFGGVDSYNNETIELLRKHKFVGSFVSASNFDFNKYDEFNNSGNFKMIGRYLPKHYVRMG